MSLTQYSTGSQLTKVSDAAADVVYAGASDFSDGANSATEYTYDSDGRLLSDANKDITSIKYNALGLPSEITFGDGSSITNLYSASGTLLQRIKAEPVKLVVQSALPAAVVMPNLNKTTDNHIGTLTIRNSVVTRIDTPNGYFGAGKMHYYVRDYQGNVRQVTDAYGKVEQDNHYYPYGMLMAESSDILAGAGSSSANPYLFGAKEYLTTAGANLLDFTARTYDPSTLLFHTQDPMSGDYTSFLPYLYCGSDPVNRIDPTGKDIAVLLVEGTPGHMGLLISTEDGKWLYYSVNGNNVTFSGNFSGGKKFNEVAVDREWSSPQDFLDSEFNTAPAQGGEDDPNYANYNYAEAYQIKTTPEQDKIIAETFTEIANEKYGLFSNNCAHAVQRSLQKAGVLPSEMTTHRYFSPGNLGYTISLTTKDKTFFKPSAAFSVIKSNVPSGKSYFKSK